MSGSHRGVPERIEETRNCGRCQEARPSGERTGPERGGWIGSGTELQRLSRSTG